MMKLDTRADLEALHKGNVKEGLHLEYKASDSVDRKDDKKKLELARDVSAFANAAGGQIIYSMTEKDHEPAGLDLGVDPNTYPTIWFEQILQQHVTPALHGISIRHVSISSNGVAVVIDVPATNGDPHQVSDGKYYRRHNFNRLAMEHYEIRDMFRRTTAPELIAELDLIGEERALLTYNPHQEVSNPIALGITVRNLSNQPALYSAIQIGFDAALSLINLGDFSAAKAQAGFQDRSWVTRTNVTPRQVPIFKEADIKFSPILLGFHSRLLQGASRHRITVAIRAPGFSSDVDWFIHQEGANLRLLPPNHPIAR